MNPNAQRIAIAESQGWTYEPNHDPMFPWRHRESKTVAYTTYLPDYLNDLNAMYEAEKSMTDIQQCQFCDFIFRIMNSKDGVSEFDKVHSTAAQRCEAFLKTLGLWEDAE